MAKQIVTKRSIAIPTVARSAGGVFRRDSFWTARHMQVYRCIRAKENENNNSWAGDPPVEEFADTREADNKFHCGSGRLAKSAKRRIMISFWRIHGLTCQ